MERMNTVAERKRKKVRERRGKRGQTAEWEWEGGFRSQTQLVAASFHAYGL